MPTAFPISAARRVAASLSLVFCSCLAAAQNALPHAVDAALARAKVPRDAVTMLVAEVGGQQPPRLAWRSQEPVNPASVMKLVTTYAGLDLLGPAYTWTTPVYVEGRVSNGTLEGNLYIEGRGDPKLVIERLWLLLRRVQALGIQRINGDIVLDRSAFDPGEHDPGAFDGRPLKAYNAGADALLVNYKSAVMTFTPDTASQTARVSLEPPLAGVALPSAVPLAANGSSCGDWRSQLRAQFQPASFQFEGSYPAACGEGSWALAYPEPKASASAPSPACGRRWAASCRARRAKVGCRPAWRRPSRCSRRRWPRWCATSTSTATT